MSSDLVKRSEINVFLVLTIIDSVSLEFPQKKMFIHIVLFLDKLTNFINCSSNFIVLRKHRCISVICNSNFLR